MASGEAPQRRLSSEELPLPDPKAKGWEFTDLAGLEIDSFAEARAEATLTPAPEGIVVRPLREALESHPELLHRRLGSLVSMEDPSWPATTPSGATGC